jgi:hypothetical protein
MLHDLQFLMHAIRAFSQERNFGRKCCVDAHQGLYEHNVAAKTFACFTHYLIFDVSKRLEALRVDSRDRIWLRDVGHVDASSLSFVSFACIWVRYVLTICSKSLARLSI